MKEYTNEMILRDIYKCYKLLGIIPRLKDVGYSRSIIQSRFGSWTNALYLAGVTGYKMTRKNLLDYRKYQED